MKPNLILVTELPQLEVEANNVASDNYLRALIDVSLSTNGIDDVIFAPEQPIEAPNGKTALASLVRRVCGQLEDNKLNVIGISTYSSTARYGLELAERVKKFSAPRGIDVMVIGGGSLFYRQSLQRKGKPINDSIDFALSQKAQDGTPHFDGVVFGGLQALIDIYRKIESGAISKNGVFFPTESPSGYYYKQGDGPVSGTGISALARMDYTPFALHQYPNGTFTLL